MEKKIIIMSLKGAVDHCLSSKLQDDCFFPLKSKGERNSVGLVPECMASWGPLSEFI